MSGRWLIFQNDILSFGFSGLRFLANFTYGILPHVSFTVDDRFFVRVVFCKKTESKVKNMASTTLFRILPVDAEGSVPQCKHLVANW